MFDRHNSLSWVCLASNIERWLLEVATDRRHPQWQWGLDLFWLSFIAAHLNFPAGEQCPLWNPDIPFSGAFLMRWLDNLGHSDDEDLCPSTNPDNLHYQSVRADLWAEWERQIGLFT
jgi:hypothetical protein